MNCSTGGICMPPTQPTCGSSGILQDRPARRQVADGEGRLVDVKHDARHVGDRRVVGKVDDGHT